MTEEPIPVETVAAQTGSTISRLRVMALLKENEQRLRDFSDNVLAWIWEIDHSGKYTYSSGMVKQILGYKPQDIRGKYFYDFFHPEEQDKLKKASLETVAKSKPFRNFINRNIHKDGRTVWLLTSGVPLLDKNGNLIGYRGADTDITERKQYEKELIEKDKELESKTNKLEEMNIALNVLLNKRDEDKIALQEHIVANVRELTFPYIGKLKKSNLNNEQKIYTELIESSLDEIISPFSHQLSSSLIGLTSTEIKIADLVKRGKTTKEIAAFANLSPKTIERYRENIRKKINIKNKNINLQSYLSSLL